MNATSCSKIQFRTSQSFQSAIPCESWCVIMSNKLFSYPLELTTEQVLFMIYNGNYCYSLPVTLWVTIYAVKFFIWSFEQWQNTQA